MRTNKNTDVNASENLLNATKPAKTESKGNKGKELIKSKDNLFILSLKTMLMLSSTLDNIESLTSEEIEKTAIEIYGVDKIDAVRIKFSGGIEKVAENIASQATVRQANGSLSKAGFIADCLSFTDNNLIVDKNKVCELFNSHLESKGLPVQEKSTGKIDQNMGKVFTRILSDLVSENVITLDNLKLRLKKIGEENITAIGKE